MRIALKGRIEIQKAEQDSMGVRHVQQVSMTNFFALSLTQVLGVYGETEALTSKECTAPCPVGTYRPTTGAMDVKDCIRCPRETYIPTTGSTSCLSCPAGTYSIKLGSYSLDDCKTCPPSYRGNKCTGGVEAVGG